jgi:hypothetical protein
MHVWRCVRWLWHGGKWEDVLIKDNITRYVDTICWHMKALVAFMKRTITQKYTFLRPKFKLSMIIWTKMGPTGTPEHLKEGIVRSFM